MANCIVDIIDSIKSVEYTRQGLCYCPAVQDFWMLLFGNENQMNGQLSRI